MEMLPLFLSIALYLAWALVALFMAGKARVVIPGMGFALSILQMGSAVWAAVTLAADPSGLHWAGTWFALSGQGAFEAKLAVDPLAVLYWLTLSAVVALSAYFALRARAARPVSRGEAVSLPLIGLGALLVICSANFVAFCAGWLVVGFMSFMAVAFSGPTRDDRARASFRYAVLSAVPGALLAAGVLGCHAAFGTLNFAEINAKAGGGESWAFYCLVAGVMLRNMQIPLMQSARHLAAAESSSFPALLVGHALIGPALLTKLYPAIGAIEDMAPLALIPAVTAVASAALALPERNPAALVGWVVSYVSASVFLSGLAGDYQAAQALAITGTLGAFLLAGVLTELRPGERGARWYAALVALVFAGAPLTGWGWARYLEYVGLLRSDNPFVFLRVPLFGAKLLADLVMAFVFWALCRERWIAGERAGKLRWDAIIPLGLIAVACLSVSVGGRPFGGILGETGFDLVPELSWFERLVRAPGAVRPSGAIEIIGSEADISARVLFAGIFVVSALAGMLWLFRDDASLAVFRKFCARVDARLGGSRRREESLLWAWCFRPAALGLGRAAAFVDDRIVDFLLADAWARPARFVRRVAAAFESRLLDHWVVDGLGVLVATVGKSLRLVQNGQVQFYFGVGIILMTAVIVKFILGGG